MFCFLFFFTGIYRYSFGEKKNPNQTKTPANPQKRSPLASTSATREIVTPAVLAGEFLPEARRRRCLSKEPGVPRPACPSAGSAGAAAHRCCPVGGAERPGRGAGSRRDRPARTISRRPEPGQALAAVPRTGARLPDQKALAALPVRGVRRGGAGSLEPAPPGEAAAGTEWKRSGDRDRAPRRRSCGTARSRPGGHQPLESAGPCPAGPPPRRPSWGAQSRDQPVP